MKNVGRAHTTAAVGNDTVAVASAAGGCKGATAVKECMQYRASRKGNVIKHAAGDVAQQCARARVVDCCKCGNGPSKLPAAWPGVRGSVPQVGNNSDVLDVRAEAADGGEREAPLPTESW